MRINNIYYNNIMTNMKTISTNYSKNVERLSTGKRINNAADSPSEILRISRLESQFRGNRVAQSNIKQGIGLLETMDSALTSMKDIGMRIKELDLQYKNGTLSDTDKNAIKLETTELYKEINHILENTTYNGKKLFEEGKINIQTGPNENDKYDINKPSINLNDYFTTNTTNTTNTISSRLLLTNKPNTSIGLTTSPKEDIYLKPEDVKVIDSYHDFTHGYVTKYENNWVVTTHSKDSIEGWSKIYKDGQLVVEGYFDNGKLNGFGRIYEDGKMIREGFYKDNTLNGWGEVSYSDGTSFKGFWKDGQKNGWGVFYDKNGHLVEAKYWGDSEPPEDSEEPPNIDNDYNRPDDIPDVPDIELPPELDDSLPPTVDDDTTKPPNTDGSNDNSTDNLPNIDGDDTGNITPPNNDGNGDIEVPNPDKDNGTTIPPNNDDGDDTGNITPPNNNDGNTDNNKPPNIDGDDTGNIIPPNNDNVIPDTDGDNTLPPNVNDNDNNIPPNLEDNSNTGNITLSNIDQLIDDISSMQSTIGSQQRILEYRLSYQENMEELNTKTYDEITSVDIAKEMMDSVKNQMLMQTNITLLHQNLENHKDYILQLLR